MFGPPPPSSSLCFCRRPLQDSRRLRPPSRLSSPPAAKIHDGPRPSPPLSLEIPHLAPPPSSTPPVVVPATKLCPPHSNSLSAATRGLRARAKVHVRHPVPLRQAVRRRCEGADQVLGRSCGVSKELPFNIRIDKMSSSGV